MASVSSLGIGSGLDLSGLLSKLMQAEALPLQLMNQQLSSTQTKVSGLGTILSKLSSLQTAANNFVTPTNIDLFKATTADSTIANATAATGAVAGTYSVNVSQLATAHTLNSVAFASSSTVVGNGTLNISGGGGSPFSVTIGATNNTVAGIRDAINSAVGNTGVQATVITDTGGARLVLTAKNSGSANTIAVSVTESGAPGLAQLSYSGVLNNMIQAQAAANATVVINGVSVSSASNTLTTAISGVTLNVTKVGNTVLTVSRDGSGATKAVTDFVNAYNDVQNTIKSLTNYDATTKTASALNGDATVRSALTTLSKALYTIPAGVTGAYKRLSDIGVSIQKDGTLAVDSTKLNKAIDTNFTDLKTLLTKFGQAYGTTVSNLTSSTGSINSHINGLNTTVTTLNKNISAFQARLAAIQTRYQQQFTALDALASRMSQTSSYLTQQLARL